MDTRGGSFTAAPATASENEPSKHVFKAFQRQISPCIQSCVFIYSWTCFESSVGCVSSLLPIILCIILHHSFYIFLFSIHPICLSFLPPLRYLLLINIHGAKASLFLCCSLKVILLEALLSVPATACELKVLICIHKITHEAISSNF